MSVEKLPKMIVGNLEEGRALAQEMEAGGFPVDLWWSYDDLESEPRMYIECGDGRAVHVKGVDAILNFAFPEE